MVLLAVLFYSCQSDDNAYQDADTLDSHLIQRIESLFGSRTALILPLSTDISSIPSDPNNPITEAKVELGRLLYHETGLATNPKLEDGMLTYSCASCHHFDAGFQSGMRQGIGDGGVGFGISGEARQVNPNYQLDEIDVQAIRTPTALNVAFQTVMLWNGQFGATGPNVGTESQWTPGTPKENNSFGFEGVETQALAGLDVHRLMVNTEDIMNSDYKQLFDDAFPNSDEDERYSKVNAALAIAAYERTLLANEAPFQNWLKGNYDAMTNDEKEGAMLFFDKGQCFQCHSGPALNDMNFYALGMNDLQGPEITTVVNDVTKRGRGGFTGNPVDDYKFKTPQLYNLKDVQFFGHGGTFETLKSVVDYKNTAIAENAIVPQSQLSERFIPLNLTESEIDLLVLFLEESLYDNNLQRFVPTELPSGNCFPNADPQSAVDLGCD